MPTRIHPTGTSARELTELSAIMRSIAMERKGAASALRDMAEHYEMKAVASQITRAWESMA